MRMLKMMILPLIISTVITGLYGFIFQFIIPVSQINYHCKILNTSLGCSFHYHVESEYVNITRMIFSTIGRPTLHPRFKLV